jgi:cell division protein FtsI (penicillin-binding protein 3)
VVFILVALAACAIPYKIAVVQLKEGDKWRAKAEQVNFQYREVPATRGNIYAGDGSLLATSLPFYRVAIDPTMAKEAKFKSGIDSLSRMLAGFYNDKSATAYKRMIQDARLDKKRFLIINRKQIGYQDMQKMTSWPIFRDGRLGGGVIFDKVEKRYLPFNSLASRTVGFLNEDENGAGIEYSFNNYLKGKDGKALFQRLAGGSWKPMFDADDIKPENGYDVFTTLDVNIQDVAETALRNQLKDREAAFGSVIVMGTALVHPTHATGRAAPGYSQAARSAGQLPAASTARRSSSAAASRGASASSALPSLTSALAVASAATAASAGSAAVRRARSDAATCCQPST